MELDQETACKILAEVKKVTNEQLIIVNDKGEIIASTDIQRIGNIHEGAKRVYKTQQRLTITPKMARELLGVKPGINLPITFHHRVIGVIGITGRPKDVEPFAELICRMTELMIRESYYTERKEWETRNIETFFHEWIYSKYIDQELMDRGHSLGVSFSQPYQCILIQFEKDFISHEVWHSVENDVYASFRDIFDDTKDFLIQWGSGRFLLIKNQSVSVSDENLMNQLRQWHQYMLQTHHIRLAMGVAKTNTPKTISHSYQESYTALKVAVQNGIIIFYDTLLLELILENIPSFKRTVYIERVFEKLKDDALIETVRTYLNTNLSLKETSQQLHIHINTLHYRLKQIKMITNIDPKTSEGITIYAIAFALKDKEDL